MFDLFVLGFVCLFLFIFFGLYTILSLTNYSPFSFLAALFLTPFFVFFFSFPFFFIENGCMNWVFLEIWFGLKIALFQNIVHVLCCLSKLFIKSGMKKFLLLIEGGSKVLVFVKRKRKWWVNVTCFFCCKLLGKWENGIVERSPGTNPNFPRTVILTSTAQDKDV